MGSPGRSTFTAVLPFGVETSSHLTGAPIAAALVVRWSRPLEIGVSKSICNHWPSARSMPLLNQPVAGSPSTVDAGLLDGEVPPSWVASEAALETVIEAPLQRPSTRGVFATG